MTLAELTGLPLDTLTGEDLEMARIAGQVVARLNGSGSIRVDAAPDRGPPQTFVLPARAVRLLTDILAHLGEGRSVAVIPTDSELTTQQAADLLNVSRPYLTKLLVEGHLPYRMVGTHRRIRLADLMEYRKMRDARSDRAMQELVDIAQELNMGY